MTGPWIVIVTGWALFLLAVILLAAEQTGLGMVLLSVCGLGFVAGVIFVVVAVRRGR